MRGLHKFDRSEQVCNFRWLKQYREQGVDGLREKGGRGVRPLMDSSDRPAVEEAISKQRMSIKTAKAEWEKSSGKKVSDPTTASLSTRY